MNKDKKLVGKPPGTHPQRIIRIACTDDEYHRIIQCPNFGTRARAVALLEKAERMGLTVEADSPSGAKLKISVIAKLAAEGLTLRSDWHKIEQCLSKCVMPSRLIEAARELRGAIKND